MSLARGVLGKGDNKETGQGDAGVDTRLLEERLPIAIVDQGIKLVNKYSRVPRNQIGP